MNQKMIFTVSIHLFSPMCGSFIALTFGGHPFWGALAGSVMTSCALIFHTLTIYDRIIETAWEDRQAEKRLKATCDYWLSEMTRKRCEFEAAEREARS